MKLQILLIGFTIVLIISCFIGCKQKKRDTETGDKSLINAVEDTQKNNFPYDKCTSLVFYAGHSLDDNPNENFPSLILHEYDSDVNFLISDNVPILSVLTKEQMLKELANYKNTEKKEEKEILRKIVNWVKARASEGYSSFLYELEPPSMAGKAYPLAKAAEKLVDQQ